ncbi:MAG TPA: DNA-binding domain-containing protein [Polyangiaceae bacterium]|nr:DNA-binding domain-containing protein [Polyangiaceae bacterium]
MRHLQQLRALPRDPALSLEAADRLTGNERVAPVEQIEIYREQFWLRHTSSLVEDFPGLGGILGQADWERLVESYLQAFAPDSWTLRELGRRFPEHVARHPELPHHQLCCDMARLEWAFIELFDAADCPPLDLAKLGTLPPNVLETGQILLNPALRLLEVSYPVADLRMQLLESRRNGHAGAGVQIPDPLAQQLVLYRASDRRLYHRPMSPEAFSLLSALERRLSLVAACEHALQAWPEHAERLQQNVAGWFQAWARCGWIVDVVPGPASEAGPPRS